MQPARGPACPPAAQGRCSCLLPPHRLPAAAPSLAVHRGATVVQLLGATASSTACYCHISSPPGLKVSATASSTARYPDLVRGCGVCQWVGLVRGCGGCGWVRLVRGCGDCRWPRLVRGCGVCWWACAWKGGEAVWCGHPKVPARFTPQATSIVTQ